MRTRRPDLMPRRTKAERRAELVELMAATCNRLREESALVDVVVVVVGTTGKAGEVLIDYGQSNPAAVFGVMSEALESLDCDEPEEIEGEDD